MTSTPEAKKAFCSGFSLVEILVVLAILGILASFLSGRNLFLAFLPNAAQHPSFSKLAEQTSKELCGESDNETSPRRCFRFGNTTCEKLSQAIAIGCLNDFKSSIPPFMTAKEERYLMSLAYPCIAKRWQTKLGTLEFNLQNAKCASALNSSMEQMIPSKQKPERK